MTQDEKRVRIAEACGWKLRTVVVDDEWDSEHGKPIRIWTPPPAHASDYEIRGDRSLPDYFSSLDAMHEAEKVLFQPPLTRMKRRTYFELLTQIAGDSWHATAAQRAESFGRTLNLWNE